LFSKKLNTLFSNISKPIWTVLGSLFVGIGILGIFLPLLPTTPFLLLAAYSFNRGNEKMRKWFEKNKIVSTYIRNYREKKGMTLRAKMNSIFVLWLSIGISFYLVDNLYIRIILCLVLIPVTIHLILLPQLKE
jgi:uncharacterized protein